MTGTGGARDEAPIDATRGDLLSLGVSPPEDNSWCSMFSLGDRVGRAEDINTDASLSLFCRVLDSTTLYAVSSGVIHKPHCGHKCEYHFKGHEPSEWMLRAVYTQFNTLPPSLYTLAISYYFIITLHCLMLKLK